MVQRTSKRSNLLIDRTFQLKYALSIGGLGAAIALFFGALMYQAHVESSRLLDIQEPVRAAIKTQDATLLWLVAAIAIVMSAALTLIGILVTHRVAGPVFVLSRYLHLLGAGHYPKLRPLRRNDELKNLHEELREAIDAMKARDKKMGEELRDLALALDSAAGTNPSTTQALAPIAETLRRMSGRILEMTSDEVGPEQAGEGAPSERTAA